MTKLNFKEMWVKASKYLVHISKMATIVAAVLLSFFLGETYQIYKSRPKMHYGMQKTKTHSETSVAINERNEILIMDRTSGKYQIFSDSVGFMIFDLYASKMYKTSITSNKDDE